MTKEDKELLLKDLCGRLTCGVKVKFGDSKPALLTVIEHDEFGWQIGSEDEFGGMITIIDNVKPYLFPLSSMTEEQREEALPLLNNCDYYDIEGTIKWLDKHPIKFFDWCDKNHFDYRGLIPMGIAIDATNKNIY